MKSPRAVRVLVGLIFILFGGVLFLKWAGVDVPFDIPSPVFSWPVILIVLGVYFLVSGNRNSGLIMLLVGVVFFTRQHYGIPIRDIVMVVIPVFLVLAGLFLIFPGLKKQKREHVVTDDDPTIQAVHIFSGGSRFVESGNFSGGEVLCIFGGADIHFRGSMLAAGNNILHTTCIFGGCDIYVPDDWTVQLETTNIFGDASDKRFKDGGKLDEHPGKILIIKGFMLFGGLDVKKA